MEPSGPRPSVSLADKVSVFPIAQQIVGLGGVLLNSIKIIFDLCVLTKTSIQLQIKGRDNISRKVRIERSVQALEDQLKSLNGYETWSPEKKEQELRSLIDGSMGLDMRIYKAHLKYMDKLKIHAKNIGENLIRLTPIAGSIYSVRKWCRARPINMSSREYVI